MKKFGIMTLCFTMLVGTTFGAVASKKITAIMKDTNLFVNGNKQASKVIQYNNTTYVPLRQISTMLGEEVSYDSNGLYIGEKPVSTNTNIDEYEKYRLLSMKILQETLQYGETIEFDKASFKVDTSSGDIDITGNMTRQNKYGNFVPSDFLIVFVKGSIDDIHIFVDGDISYRYDTQKGFWRIR